MENIHNHKKAKVKYELLKKKGHIRKILLISSIWLLCSYAYLAELIYRHYLSVHGNDASMLLASMNAVLAASTVIQLIYWKQMMLPQLTSLSPLRDALLFCREQYYVQRRFVCTYLITYLCLQLVATGYYLRYVPEGLPDVFRNNLPSGIVVLIFCIAFLNKLAQQIRSVSQLITLSRNWAN